MKIIPLRQENGDIYVIEEEAIISQSDVLSLSPIPTSIFEYDSTTSSLYQLCQKVYIIYFFLMYMLL